MRIVSGIQPTGNLHLGNYLGAIRNWVRMQDDAAAQGGDCLFFLADLHAISMPHVPAELTANTRAMTAALVACGIDTDRSTPLHQATVTVIGRGSAGERGVRHGWIPGVAVSQQKKR